MLAYQVLGSKNVVAKLCQAPQGRSAKAACFIPGMSSGSTHPQQEKKKKLDLGEKGEELLSTMKPSTYGLKYPFDGKLYIMIFFF